MTLVRRKNVSERGRMSPPSVMESNAPNSLIEFSEILFCRYLNKSVRTCEGFNTLCLQYEPVDDPWTNRKWYKFGAYGLFFYYCKYSSANSTWNIFLFCNILAPWSLLWFLCISVFKCQESNLQLHILHFEHPSYIIHKANTLSIHLLFNLSRGVISPCCQSHHYLSVRFSCHTKLHDTPLLYMKWVPE